MSSLFLLLGALLFAWLAYDAWKLSIPANDTSYPVSARLLGQSSDGVPADELHSRKQWNSWRGLGDLSQSVWLWCVLSLTCAIAAILPFLS